MGFSPEILARVASLFFSALALITMWLTGEYHAGDLKIQSLLRWAYFGIGLSIVPVMVFFAIFLTNLSLLSLIFLLQGITFLLPPTLILHYLRIYRERELVP